jgi:hypothetical protein
LSRTPLVAARGVVPQPLEWPHLFIWRLPRESTVFSRVIGMCRKNTSASRNMVSQFYRGRKSCFMQVIFGTATDMAVVFKCGSHDTKIVRTNGMRPPRCRQPAAHGYENVIDPAIWYFVSGQLIELFVGVAENGVWST